jgi:hypothetical protein
MTMIRYNIQAGANGAILIPATPFAVGMEIEVALIEKNGKYKEKNPKEREAAFDEFMVSWKGCLKGVPHMTAKEIRAERLEKKYGDKK